MAALIGAAALLHAASAAADPIADRFGSDEANAENLRVLAEWWGKGSHFELRGGAWFANLSRGPGAAFAADRETIGGEPADAAATRIGTGSGLVKEFGVSLAVRGNEALFDFLSDELFDAAEQELVEDVESEYLRDAILLLAGELRPDLTSLLGPSAQVWLGASYGRLRGRIEDASYFYGRDGRPYFAGQSAAWTTRLLLVEGGVFFVAHDEDAEGPALDTGQGTDLRVGGYARYFHFSMPTVVGFPEGFRGQENVLQTATVNGGGVGVRVEAEGCAYLCATIDFSVVPFLGFATADLGPWGTISTVPVVLSVNPGVAVPVPLGRVMVVRPYASFRLDWLALGLAGDVANAGIPGSEGGLVVDASIPDFLTWGPRLGLAVDL